MQIRGIRNNSSIKHVIVVNTWMKTNKTSNTIDMDKFFDKKGLIDTIQTMYTIC